MRREIRAARLLLALGLGFACSGAAGAQSRSQPQRQATRREAPVRIQEAAFLRTVDRANTANVITGDLVHYAGTHIAYRCDVDNVVRSGLILGQCGSAAEPMDLFIHLPTNGLRAGERLQVLGIVEQPAMWTDITGHTVYYAFIKAVFVNRMS